MGETALYCTLAINNVWMNLWETVTCLRSGRSMLLCVLLSLRSGRPLLLCLRSGRPLLLCPAWGRGDFCWSSSVWLRSWREVRLKWSKVGWFNGGRGDFCEVGMVSTEVGWSLWRMGKFLLLKLKIWPTLKCLPQWNHVNLFEPHCPCYICGVQHELTLAIYQSTGYEQFLVMRSRLEVNQSVVQWLLGFGTLVPVY